MLIWFTEQLEEPTRVEENFFPLPPRNKTTCEVRCWRDQSFATWNLPFGDIDSNLFIKKQDSGRTIGSTPFPAPEIQRNLLQEDLKMTLQSNLSQVC